MSLKESFNKTVQAVGRFFDRQELKQLEARKITAEAGYLMSTGGRACVFMKLRPEEAKGIVDSCNRRIGEIQQKHGWSPKP